MDYEMLMPRAYCSSVEVLNLTAKLCKDAIDNNIPGDFCECGTAYAVHGIVMRDCAVNQKVYLYDSFEGINIHSPEDKEWTDVHGEAQGDPRKSGGITVCKIEDVQNTMLHFLPNLEGIIFKKGWFIDTFKELTDEQFSVLRLDCDLYHPYKLCLEYMYPRLSVGGFLLVDDIVLSGCRQAIIESGLKIEDFTIDENKMAWLKKK
jgi:O-methyltransferase